MRKKPASLNILILEDSPDDKDLIELELLKENINATFYRVETEEEFKKALQFKTWDVILSDYSLPTFDGISALQIVNETDLDIPFILVSGNIGEELAVKAMKSGAHDYILKDNLNRLGPAVLREVKEAQSRELQRKTEHEKQLLITVLENSLNEVYLADLDNLKIEYANKTALENLGINLKSIQKKTLADINPNLAFTEYRNVLELLLSEQKKQEFYITKHQRNDGSLYPIEVRFSLIRFNNRPFVYIIGIDITDQRRNQALILEQKKLARELTRQSEYKSAFLANMSHELRTPLNTITLLSELISHNRQENLTEDQLEKLAIIRSSGNHLMELINEILDLSKIEAGEMTFNLEEHDIEELLSSLKKIFHPRAEKTGVTFTTSMDRLEPISKQIITDKLRIMQVLKNLLANAFKFTEHGSITIDAFTPHSDQVHDLSHNDKNWIGFKVCDTGIGIPKNKLKTIFENFQQADGSTSRNYGGTGLGLSISKQIIEAMGGTISVTSQKGSGSQFTVILPSDITNYVPSEYIRSEDKKLNSRNKPAATDIPESESSLNLKEVLLLSKDNEIHDKLKERVHEIGMTLKKTSHSSVFWDLMDQSEPDYCIIDFNSDGQSGYTVLKKLQASYRSVPILIFDNEKDLIHTDVLESVQLTKRSMVNNHFLDLPKTPESVGTNQKADILLADDSEIHSEVLVEFLSDHANRIDCTQTAADTLKQAQRHAYDIVILDLSLPDGSGHQVLKQLKTEHQYSTPSVIIYSGKHLHSVEKDELLKYADDIISKNIGSINTLKKRIQQYLNYETDHGSGNAEAVQSNEAPHILIADDNPASFYSISSVLKEEGISVSHAKNGAEAVKWLLDPTNHADIVLMDMMMPVVDGFDAIRNIRSNTNFNNLPVIAVTAKAMKGDRERCLEAGATDYIGKPIDTSILKELIAVWS